MKGIIYVQLGEPDGSLLGIGLPDPLNKLCQSGAKQYFLGYRRLVKGGVDIRVTASGTSMELQTSRGLRFCCSTKAMQEMRMDFPNRRIASYLLDKTTDRHEEQPL